MIIDEIEFLKLKLGPAREVEAGMTDQSKRGPEKDGKELFHYFERENG
jgi:hypothetical protein